MAPGVLLTWNVAGRGHRTQEAQIAALGRLPFDVLCLQEVTPTTKARWTAALEGAGLHVAVSSWPVEPKGSRRLAVLVASRAPLVPVDVPGLPWPERHLAVRTELGDAGEVELHTLHAPLSSKPDAVKVRTLEALFAAVQVPDGVPRIVAGDLNTPAYESREGVVQSFARTRAGRIRPSHGERHDRAELLLIEELPRRGWQDAFRVLHGYGRRDRSFMFAHRAFGWRLDHILLSPGLVATACDYAHEVRESGLSDHSAMWAAVVARGDAL